MFLKFRRNYIPGTPVTDLGGVNFVLVSYQKTKNGVILRHSSLFIVKLKLN